MESLRQNISETQMTGIQHKLPEAIQSSKNLKKD